MSKSAAIFAALLLLAGCGTFEAVVTHGFTDDLAAVRAVCTQLGPTPVPPVEPAT